MKMKRIAAAMLAMITALSLSACGAPTESTGASSEDTSDVQISTERTDEQADPAESTTAPAVTETTEQTTAATTAPAEPEVPEEIPVMTVEPTLVMNGSMAFKHDGKNYVYNITDNELYETEYDVDDITVLKGCVAVVGYVESNIFDNSNVTVINLKTNELYADVKPFYNTNWHNNDYLTVGKIEKGFTDNAVSSIGVLNSNGEWVLPLSTEHAICTTEYVNNMSYVYQNDKVIGFNKYLYDISKNNIISLENTDKLMTVLDITDESIILIESDGIVTCMKLYRYDILTNESVYFAESHFLHAKTTTCVASQKTTDGICEVYDIEYNLLNYDLSKYDFTIRDHEIKGATKDAIVFHATGADGNLYTIIQDKDSNFICEPIAYDKREMGDYDVYFSENKVIIRYNKANARIIDITTGEITEYDDSFEIVDYDTENNLMLVNTNGAYYLADPENPDVLINPFERANG